MMDEEIEFVQVLQMEGTRKEKVSTHNSCAFQYHIHNKVIISYTQKVSFGKVSQVLVFKTNVFFF